MSTLYVTYDELRRAICRQLGYGRTYSTNVLSTDQIQDVDDVLNASMRKVYWHRVLEEGETTPHIWSFLRKRSSIVLVVGEMSYDLPSDFSVPLGGFSFSEGSDNADLDIITSDEIRSLYAKDDKDGVPRYAAIQSISDEGFGDTKYELLVYPKPLVAETIVSEYSYAPEFSISGLGFDSDDEMHPLGGAMLSETIMECCLATADEMFNILDGPSPHQEKFQTLLLASIKADRRLTDIAGESWPVLLDTEITDFNVNKNYLDRILGKRLGYGPNSAKWSHGQQSEIDEIRRAALRKFYNPAIIPGERFGHTWSFLSPVTTMELHAGQYLYDLPPGFAMLDGPLTFEPSESVVYPAIMERGERQVQEMLQRDDASSRPLVCATRPKPLNDEQGTRYELLVAPVPEAEYKVNIRFKVNPNTLSGSASLPMGGQPHAQTIIEACMAEVEIATESGKNVRQGEFFKCLQASISHDRQAGSPDQMGYNSDNSDGMEMFSNYHDLDSNIVTYEGESY